MFLLGFSSGLLLSASRLVAQGQTAPMARAARAATAPAQPAA